MPTIVLDHKEVSKLINKLYKAINTPMLCVIDKKRPAEFIVVSTKEEKFVSIHKLCREHEIKRRLLLHGRKSAGGRK